MIELVAVVVVTGVISIIGTRYHFMHQTRDKYLTRLRSSNPPPIRLQEPSYADKDFPLMTRTRADGTKHLRTTQFPPRHEFSRDWLAKGTAGGWVQVAEDTVTLRFANGKGVYQIDHSKTEPEYKGVWGILLEGKVDG